MLTISETATGTFHYHLREVGPEGFKPGGGAGKALCGTELGWDVSFPLGAWGSDDGLSHWCEECTELWESRRVGT